MKKVVIGKISKKNAFNFMTYCPRRVLVKFGFLLLLLSQMLKKSSLSFDNDPDCSKRNAIMAILEDFDTP